MRQLGFFLVLLLVLGIAGFMYRYTLEQPLSHTEGNVPACSMEARICPDGSSVGRVPPSCDFAMCPLPNIEIKELGISFVIPAGYRVDTQVPDATLAAAFVSSPLADRDGLPSSLTVRRFPLEVGETTNDVLLRETVFEPSGLPAESLDEFTPLIMSAKTFQKVTVERFEGTVRTYFYLPRANDVIRFEVIETGVDWTNPDLVIDELPAHAAMRTLLTSLQSTP